MPSPLFTEAQDDSASGVEGFFESSGFEASEEPLVADYLTIGSGDAQLIGVATAGTRLEIRKGTAAGPDTSLHPVAKLTRTVSIAAAAISGDGAEQIAGAVSLSVGDAANEVQTTGLFGGAKNAGTVISGNISPDAAGLIGIGSIIDSGVGVGMGAYLEGRGNIATAKIGGIQIGIRNTGSTNGTYNPAGFSSSSHIWLFNNATGGATKNGAGIVFGNPNNVQWDVGIGFTSQGTGGPIAGSSIRDNSSSPISLDIQGSHSSAAIQVAAGSGHIGFGVPAGAGAQLLVQSDGASTVAAIIRGNASQGVALLQVQSSTPTTFFQIGAGGLITLGEGVNYALGTSTGTKFGTAANHKLSLWGVPPVVQPSSSGETAGFTAGGGTTATHSSTFTGNVGSTAYTVSDIVKHLKNIGALAA